MGLLSLRVGPRVIVSYSVILTIMTAIVVCALWQLASVHGMTTQLVQDKMVKQQLASDMLSAINLNSAQAVSMAKSDSLEVMDFFRTEFDKSAAKIEESRKILADQQSDSVESALLSDITAKRQEYMEAVDKILVFKERGQTLEVEHFLENEFGPAISQYMDSMKAILGYHSTQAQVLGREADLVYENGFIAMLCLGIMSVIAGSLLAWQLVRSIVTPLKNAIRFSCSVAEGNLMQQLDFDRKDEFGELMHSLNHMSESLARIVSQVREGTGVITQASSQINAGNQDLSSRTEQQAAALEKTASSMNEITTTVGRNADNAQQANLLAMAASDVAVRGGKAVSEVVHTMEDIAASAKRMGEVIRVIDDIAFQTKILSLNAAVEAARAGEQGYGFAVVASEVRGLANRSAEAAREIKNLIGESVQKVQAGSELVSKAGATMHDIVDSVRQVTAIMNEIAFASQEQSERIEQVNSAISQMEEGTQQNAALVEEAAAVSQAMENQAKHLAQMVRLFQIRLDQAKALAENASHLPLIGEAEADDFLPSEVVRLRIAA